MRRLPQLSRYFCIANGKISTQPLVFQISWLNELKRFAFILAVTVLILVWVCWWRPSTNKPSHSTPTSIASSPSAFKLPFYWLAYHQPWLYHPKTLTASKSQMILACCCAPFCLGVIEDQQFCQCATKSMRLALTLQIFMFHWSFYLCWLHLHMNTPIHEWRRFFFYLFRLVSRVAGSLRIV